jgi:hypothetical protein
MNKLYKAILFLAAGALWMSMGAPLGATTIFDNTQNDLATRFNPGLLEVGDEIILASTERYLTAFSFEYWGVNTDHPLSFAGAVQARVCFYENTGTPFNGYATPSPTSFYDSGWFSVDAPTDRSTFVFSAGADFPVGGLFIPTSDMTWGVQFEGMGLNDSVGVDLYSPVVVGQVYDDYWQTDGSSWQLMTNSVPMDFAALMQANASIPEPSMVTLWVFGGFGVLILGRWRRRKS